MKIYAGGKITPDDWRLSICPALKDVPLSTQKDPESFIVGGVFGSHDYVAPFFINRGDGVHSDGNIVKNCYRRIDRCDLFYAWFNIEEDLTAYGTAVEVGYARARSKFVVLAYQSMRSNEAWFMNCSANYIMNDVDDPAAGLKQAIEVFENQSRR